MEHETHDTGAPPTPEAKATGFRRFNPEISGKMVLIILLIAAAGVTYSLRDWIQYAMTQPVLEGASSFSDEDFSLFPEESGGQSPRSRDQWSRDFVERSFSLIDKEEILSGGPGKDGIPSLTEPPHQKPGEATYLNPADRVIGVEIGGEARAYPLRILVWHENANDVLGGKPIAVSYCPLCDSSLVFDREIGGQVREFGISGRLYRSNVLMYDRQSDVEEESLWSQLQMRAVVGPAAEQGLAMKLLQSELTTWGDWLERHPETTVLSKDTGYFRDYDNQPYTQYFETDDVSYGAHGKPERRPDLKNKDKIVVVTAGGEQRIYVVPDVAAAVGSRESVDDTLGGVRLRITYLKEADSLRVEAADAAQADSVQIAYTFWFAWEELSPGVELWSP